MAQGIAAARNRAKLASKEMSAQADDINRKARDEGRREGEQHYQEIIAEAKTAAERLLEQAHKQAEELRQTGKSHIDAAVRFVEDTVHRDEEESGDRPRQTGTRPAGAEAQGIDERVPADS